MKRNIKKLPLALLPMLTLVVALLAFSSPALRAQSQQPTSDKPPAAAIPSAPTPNTAGAVWVNTDTGVYHKQGSRWYGKTKHGKYMLEADAVKAGYKPAK